MANSLTGLVWTVDTVGLLSPGPVKIRKITFYPNTAADTVTFKYYNFGSATYKSTKSGVVATVATNQITSTGNFLTANVAAGDGISVTYTSTGNNKGNYYVVTRDSDDAVTVSYATLSDESSKKYSWTVYAQQTGPILTGSGTEKVMQELDFGDDGMWFPSFACTQISSSSDICKVYIK